MLQAQVLGCDAEQQVNMISQKILPGQANVVRQAAKTMKAVFFIFTAEYEVVPVMVKMDVR